ncbi:HPr family phosphocarrier protein [Tessaracoccus oleiagri]|uniref:Phosphocarrier protein HPr n=1 Tax=Tessaracoccus oleiagri TaxID=686624 RepID=A0A1G9HXY3_9ACTN|nr:HPr family phosphocarrier protein [Tessaracoccus oleiagri]SDL17821.1 phosphocarrier protein [Tessaracoccus oleiagri]
MITRTATIGAPNGLHARPAALFVDAVEESGLDVTISFRGETADAGSLLEVLTLGAEHGDEVELATEDDGAGEALDRLVELLVRGDA